MKKETKKTNGATELVFILDKSGSMAGLESDTIGGFNSMIDRQREGEGEVYVTTVLFSNFSDTVHDRVKIAEVPKMTNADYVVGGCTALIDAIGESIEHIASIHKYARPEDVPEHTMFVITTDGLENASRSFTSQKVKKMIEEKKKSGWKFLFLGANIDAVETAAKIGIPKERAANFKCDAAGTAVNFEAVTEAISTVRSCAPLGNSWRSKIDEDYEARK